MIKRPEQYRIENIRQMAEAAFPHYKIDTLQGQMLNEILFLLDYIEEMENKKGD